MKNNLYLILATLLFITPNLVTAQGFVPCGGPGQETCQLCHWVMQINLLVQWLVGIFTVIFAIMLIINGYKLVTSTGNVSAKEDAKRSINNVIIGFVIVLAAWLLIDFGMKSLVDDSKYTGPWQEIKCTLQPKAGIQRIYHPVQDEAGNDISREVAENAGDEGPMKTKIGTVDEGKINAAANINAAQADSLIEQYGKEAGLNDQQIKNMQALMRVESSGCQNKTSPVGALGCMQIMPNTARQYDPSLRNASDAEVKAALMNDEKNIAIGVKIYQDLHNAYNGDERKIFAGYNGGPGANDPSRDCPGMMRWECEWDNAAQTVPNTGYIETRNYVQKVSGVAAKL